MQQGVPHGPDLHPDYNHDGPKEDEEKPDGEKMVNADSEVAGFMQTFIDNPAWYAFLRGLKVSLENMEKTKRAAVVHGMLCRLEWHAANRRDGYLLGHMKGRTAEILAVLVTFKDEAEYDPAEKTPEVIEGMWNEATHFVEMHPGSPRAAGRRVGNESPLIMLENQEVPSEFLTPPMTPVATHEASGRNVRRRCELEVEISTGSRDCPTHRSRMRVPLTMDNERGEVRLSFAFTQDTGSETDEAEPETNPGATTLPLSAPGRLGELGLSQDEVCRLRDSWTRGELSYQQLLQDHGHEATSLLIQAWGDAEGHQDNNQNKQEPVNQDTDDSVLLTMYSKVGIMGSLLVQGQGMDSTDSTRSLLREHLLRQRGEGATVREQASTLFYLMENRASQHYMEHFPDYMEDLGLAVDVDASARCLPGPTPFYLWVEEELWQQFVDFFEAMSGFETEQVQRHRGTPTMPDSELQAWRRWAGMEDPMENRGRSRSPRRTPSSRSPRSMQATRGDPDAVGDMGDSVSLMHNYWGDRGTGSGERRKKPA